MHQLGAQVEPLAFAPSHNLLCLDSYWRPPSLLSSTHSPPLTARRQLFAPVLADVRRLVRAQLDALRVRPGGLGG
jgi:hypothetical protein